MNIEQKNPYEMAAAQEKANPKAVAMDGERLRTFAYPVQVSLTVLPEDLTGKKFLDAGAGENIQLNSEVRNRGGSYYAMDVRANPMQQQVEAGGMAAVGSVDKLPFAAESVDIAHARFVLSWLPPERRVEAIKELWRVSKEEVLYLDYDWSSAKGTEDFNDFVQAVTEALQSAGFDPFYGQKSFNEIKGILGEEAEVDVQTNLREPGVLYQDILAGRNAFQTWADQSGDANLAQRMRESSEKVAALAASENPPPITTTTVVIVRARRKV